MKVLLLTVLIVYITVPPAVLGYCLNLIYRKNHRYGWHFIYIAKYLATLSFLPLLYFQNIDLNLQPTNIWSFIFILLTVVLAVLGISHAVKKKVLFFYLGGAYAAFMEEILYRGVIFGLATTLWHNLWISVIVSSIAFGVWHLKNFYWQTTKKDTIYQFFYTALFYGPIFATITIYTGDIYLAVLLHYLTDATVALAPNWMRGWLVFGGRRKNDMDDYNSKK